MEQKWKTSGILYDAEEISKVLFDPERTRYHDPINANQDNPPFVSEHDMQKSSFRVTKSVKPRDYAKFGKIEKIEFDDNK